MSLGTVALRCEKAPGPEALDKYKDMQLIDPLHIAGEEHVQSAISSAELALKKGKNISKNPFIEVVVRAALNRQIKTAFELLGPGGRKEVIAISEKYPDEFIKEYGCRKDESVLLVDEKKYNMVKEAFGIEEEEIMAVSSGGFKDRVLTLQKIIAERMALLNKV